MNGLQRCIDVLSSEVMRKGEAVHAQYRQLKELALETSGEVI